MKRVFDFLVSLIAIVILSPILIIISFLVLLSSPGGIFFTQQRIGKDHKPFRLLKFRTMKPYSETSGQLTIGTKDPRITTVGYFLRRYKLDELPQLFNIVRGEMSIVGPRPEVPKYVSLYNPEQQKVLKLRPGLTDYASLEYINENEILANSPDPEKAYIEDIMPAKLKLNLKYIEDQSLAVDIRILFQTVKAIFHSPRKR
ncbi:MAG: sugar transferase [Bacteroidales bacterium]